MSKPLLCVYSFLHSIHTNKCFGLKDSYGEFFIMCFIELNLVWNIPFVDSFDASKCQLTICLQRKGHWTLSKKRVLFHCLKDRALLIGKVNIGLNNKTIDEVPPTLSQDNK